MIMKNALLLMLLLLNLGVLSADHGSVVCIHGFTRSYRSMLPMGNKLENEGFEVYLWDYQSRKETIETHAENLVDVLRTIALKKPGEPIHFVTHSVGGIITKTALNHPDCPEEAKIGRAVLLAPPAQGSCAARAIAHLSPARLFFGKRTGKQLLTYTPEQMHALGDFPPSVTVLVVSGVKGNNFLFRSPNDGKVTIHETVLSTPHHRATFFVSHRWIMTSRQVIEVTKNFLIQ